MINGPWSGNKPEVEVVAEVAVYRNHSEARPQLIIFVYLQIHTFAYIYIFVYICMFSDRFNFCIFVCCIFG